MGNLKQLHDQWGNTKDSEEAYRTVELQQLDAHREECLKDLKELEDKRAAEAAEHKAKEAEMRNAVHIERQRREQLHRMADAVLFLQQEGRKYIERIKARRAASKGKKGKKGKKK